MLGRFLELSLLATDTGSAWQRWQALGFAPAQAGDIWPHGYGVVACQQLAIGLHAAGTEPVCVSFVRQDVAQLADELALRLLAVERAQLGAEDFHLLEIREPGGVLLRVQEARTFSAPPEAPPHSALGRFRALSLPCAELADAQGFWDRLGAGLQHMQDPWECLTIESTPLANHAQAMLPLPVLIFEGGAGTDAARWREAGLVAAPPLPALRGQPHRLLHTPEGVALLVLDAPG